MSTLFELGADLDALEELLVGLGDDESERDAAVMREWLDGIEDAVEAKVDRMASVIMTIDARAAARVEEAKRLAERGAIDARRARAMRVVLQRFYEDHGLKTLETVHYRVTLAAHGGLAPLRVDDNAPPVDALPSHLVREVPARRVLDEKALRAALDAGEEFTWARLGERGRSIRIK